MKILGTAVRGFVGGAAGAAGALVLLAGIGAWMGHVVRRDLGARFEAALGKVVPRERRAQADD